MDKAERTRGVWIVGFLVALFACSGDHHLDGGRVASLRSTSTGGDPVAILAGGLADALDSAAVDLRRGARAAAMMGIDGAERGAEVAHHASGGTRKEVLAQVLAGVRWARRSVQNGRPEDAPEILERGADVARTSAGYPSGPSVASVRLDLFRYVGARVVDARGRTLGELEGFAGPIADPAWVVLTVGGWQDAFGVIDFGGDRVRVPMDAIVFGPHRRLGESLVALAAETTVTELTRPRRDTTDSAGRRGRRGRDAPAYSSGATER